MVRKSGGHGVQEEGWCSGCDGDPSVIDVTGLVFFFLEVPRKGKSREEIQGWENILPHVRMSIGSFR